MIHSVNAPVEGDQTEVWRSANLAQAKYLAYKPTLEIPILRAVSDARNLVLDTPLEIEYGPEVFKKLSDLSGKTPDVPYDCDDDL